MYADRHSSGPAARDAVHELNVEIQELIGIIASCAYRGAQIFVAEEWLRHFVDL